MISRNFSRRLEKLEERITPNEERRVIRVLYMNKDDTEPSGGYIVDPWSRLAGSGDCYKTGTPRSPRSGGR
jgi:hypothetical protein